MERVYTGIEIKREATKYEKIISGWNDNNSLKSDAFIKKQSV
jgi:hypothetical protein